MSIQQIYIDKNVIHYPLVNEIKMKLKVPIEVYQNPEVIYSYLNQNTDSIQKGKETLVLTRNKGAFIKKCPGTKHYICCGYHILHIGTFCTMDCSYCVLQSYFHPPITQFFLNFEDLYEELNLFFKEKKIYRIGTGEFTDSMLWEKWIDLSTQLVPKFAMQNYCVLELKTKTINIKNFEHLDHNRKTIMSWSVNTRKVIQEEEKGTASLAARIKAASHCQSWGYPLAFHFDPMVIYDNCIEDYQKVIDHIFSMIKPENIIWISMGTFRFMSPLKNIIQLRFPESKIVYGEFISGIDGKMRYFKPLRIKLYEKIISRIKAYAPEVLIYFCMEDEEVWQKCMGFTPDEKGGLSRMLDRSAYQHCNLKKT